MSSQPANNYSDNFRTLKIRKIFNNSLSASHFYNEIWTVLRQKPHIKIYLTSYEQVSLDNTTELEIEIIFESNGNISCQYINEELVTTIYPTLNRAHEASLNRNPIERKKQHNFWQPQYKNRKNSQRNVSKSSSNIMGVETSQFAYALIPIVLFIGVFIIAQIGINIGIWKPSSPDSKDMNTNHQQKNSPK
jgi:hypothetical protein